MGSRPPLENRALYGGCSHFISLLFFLFVTAAVNATSCNPENVNILPSALITPLIPSSMIKNEDVAPMEVSAEKRSPPVFKVSLIVI